MAGRAWRHGADGWQERGCEACAAAGAGRIWLLDGVLQYQSFMYTKGFSQMLAGTASGNPSVIARPITWDATLVGHCISLFLSSGKEPAVQVCQIFLSLFQVTKRNAS